MIVEEADVVPQVLQSLLIVTQVTNEVLCYLEVSVEVGVLEGQAILLCG